MVSLFAISQSETFSNSLFIISTTSPYECPSINTLVSSANKIENNKSDDLAKLIKLAKGVLTQSLTLISNQILRTGIFPKELKISRVKPLFKSGDPLQFNNYRPVSLLPSLSKIFEHIIFYQIMCYLTENSLLSSEQFGFRPGHSTELAALRMVDHIIKQMDNGKLL